MTTLDDTDQQLIALLRQDVRPSVATLAGKLGVSRGTVSNRLRKLEDGGVIVGCMGHLSQVLERIWLLNGIRSTGASIHLASYRRGHE